jgi:hypothetical protein
MRYANVTSSLALFVALGGTGYAALKLPHDSVGASQIKAGAVRSSEVKNHSLRAVDFATLPQGPQGAQGPKGDQGAPGRDATQVVLATGSDSNGNDIDIGSSNSIVDSHQLRVVLTTTAPSRILAQAAITLKDSSPNASAVDAGCKITLDDPPPALAAGTALGQTIFAHMPTLAGTHANLSVVGRSAHLDPGTYYITLHCLSNESGATFDAGDLTAMAVAD